MTARNKFFPRDGADTDREKSLSDSSHMCTSQAIVYISRMCDSFKIPDAVIRVPKPASESKEITKNITSPNSEDVEKENPQAFPYREPKWSKKPPPDMCYRFEVLKSGSIIEKVEKLQEKCFWVFGRLGDCDIVMAHPTISRYHAVFQYKGLEPKSGDSGENEHGEERFGPGWYIYDLGSTHGTFLNKVRIPTRTYIPVKVGHMIKLGASTRSYILQGPEFDQEPESPLTVTELKELRAKEKEQQENDAKLQENLREKDGISWGMAEDADEETDLTVNPYASTNNEELFLDDPKKTLRGFFEREGLDLEYKVDEMSAGTFVCRVELPIDDANGKPLVAEVCHKGKKKDCVAQCALEACRILDRHGILRQSHHEPLKRKVPTKDSDDEDDFLDRTGDIERKKQRKAESQKATLTYDDLLKQEKEILAKLTTVNENILKYKEFTKRSKERMLKEDDDLDTFMANLLDDSNFDKTEIRKLRVDQQRLQAEHEKLQKLIKIAKPTDLPSISFPDQQVKSKPLLSLFGKRNKTKFVIPRVEKKEKVVEKELKSDEEEVEEIEEEEAPEVAKDEKESESFLHSHSDTTTKLEDTTKAMDNAKPEPRRIIGPAFIPPDILNSDSTVQSTKEEQNVKGASYENDCDDDQVKDDSATSKKKRTRIRIRGKARENVDIDDSVELLDAEKYSGWVPPENQTGDGITSLNQKFGY